MAVSLSPRDFLSFWPLTQHVVSPLIITNNNNQPIAFKIKTSAPKWYCVRPNSGRIEPGEHAEVTVILQVFDKEPPLNANSTHKLLIQSSFIPLERESMSPHEICASPEASEKGKIHQQKIRVLYLPPRMRTLYIDENILANTAMIISPIRLPRGYTTPQRRPHPEPRCPPRPLEDPHLSAEPSPPLHSNIGTVHEESGDAPPIAQEDEPPHLHETSFHIPPDPEQMAQPTPEPEQDPFSAPDSALTAVTIPQEDAVDASGDESESPRPTRITSTAGASPLHQNTTIPPTSATGADVRMIAHGAKEVIPSRLVTGVFVFFSKHIFMQG